MISICIPVYNHDVNPLVRSLHRQALQAGVEFEIVIADDHSQKSFIEANRALADLPEVKLIFLGENIGRSRIRNLLAEKASYPWLIFMDCDSACPDEKFIERYLPFCHTDAVVCGGRIYREKPADHTTRLHWLSGTRREVKTAEQRKQNPWNSFMTCNFLIAASLFQKIRFNENIRVYGHEDTLFGLELKMQNIPVSHTDNPLIHEGLQNAEEFLEKTEMAAGNLLRIYQMTAYRDEFTQMVRLLKTWKLLKKTGMLYPAAITLSTLQPAVLKNLKGPDPSMLMLDVYKLNAICSADRQMKN
jgi:glycosyltransferase involved in cell wall biosynthesis